MSQGACMALAGSPCPLAAPWDRLCSGLACAWPRSEQPGQLLPPSAEKAPGVGWIWGTGEG